MLNLVLQMEDGRITDYIWDNGCYGCEGTAECASGLEMRWDDNKGIVGSSPDIKTAAASYCTRAMCSAGGMKDCDVKVGRG